MTMDSSNHSISSQSDQKKSKNRKINFDPKEIFLKLNGDMNALGQVIYSPQGVGPIFAFPLMVFNAVTTTIGAGILLPSAVGYAVGILFSIIYFFIAAPRDIKREHPLRRNSLLLIFAVTSAYASTASIYTELNKTQDLQKKTYESAVQEHNKFITRLNKIVNDKKKQIEVLHPAFLKLPESKIQLQKYQTERTELIRIGDLDSVGFKAEQMNEKYKEIKQLENQIKSADQDFLEYSKISEFTKKIRTNWGNKQICLVLEYNRVRKMLK